MDNKKCKCGLENKIFCKKCSKVSMSILLKNGNDHLKYENYRGHKCCPIWYSPLKHNRKPEKDVIEGMLRRFFDSPLVPAANQLRFYYNGTQNEIFTYKL